MNVALGQVDEVAGLEFFDPKAPHLDTSWSPPGLLQHGYVGTLRVPFTIYDVRAIAGWVWQRIAVDPERFVLRVARNVIDLFRVDSWPPNFGPIHPAAHQVWGWLFFAAVVIPGLIGFRRACARTRIERDASCVDVPRGGGRDGGRRWLTRGAALPVSVRRHPDRFRRHGAAPRGSRCSAGRDANASPGARAGRRCVDRARDRCRDRRGQPSGRAGRAARCCDSVGQPSRRCVAKPARLRVPSRAARCSMRLATTCFIAKRRAPSSGSPSRTSSRPASRR